MNMHVLDTLWKEEGVIKQSSVLVQTRTAGSNVAVLAVMTSQPLKHAGGFSLYCQTTTTTTTKKERHLGAMS